MESRNPVTCTSQYRANFFRYVIYTRAYRILHSLRARSLERLRANKKNHSRGANAQEEFRASARKIFWAFSAGFISDRLVRFYARRHRKSVLSPVRSGIVDGISTGQWAGFVFLPQFPPTRPAHYGFGSTLQRGRRRVIKHLRVFHVCFMSSRAHTVLGTCERVCCHLELKISDIYRATSVVRG